MAAAGKKRKALTLRDGAVPAPESAAKLAEAAAELGDVLAVRDVHAQGDRVEEREEHGHQHDEDGVAGGERDDQADDPDNHVRPDRALEGGETNLLSD